MAQRPPRPTQRKRYCDIKATSLEEVLATCERHITNISKTQLDLIDNEDGTPTDTFYIDMWREAWKDLRDDVQAILAKQQPDTSPPKREHPVPAEFAVHVVEHAEYERGMGQRPDGFTAHKTQKEAVEYINKQNVGRDGPTPDEYVQYHYIGLRTCSGAFYGKMLATKSGYAYFDKIHELQK